MSNNVSKRIIKFQAQFEDAKGFGKWLQDIEKNIDMSVDNSFTKWIKEYKTRLESLVKTINAAGDEPGGNVIATMHKEMKGMFELAKKISNQFSKMSLGEKGSQLQKLSENIQTASRNKRNAQANVRNWENKLSIDQKTLSDAELKRIYDKNAKKGFTFGGQAFGGADGKNLQEFIESVKKVAEDLNKIDDDTSKAIQNRLETINKNITSNKQAVINAAEQLKAAKDAFNDSTKSAINDSGSGANASAVEGQDRVNQFAISSDEAADAIKAHEDTARAQAENTRAAQDFNKENQKTPNIIGKAAKQVFAYGTVVSLFKRLISGAKRTIIELDAAFTNMAVVTNLTRQEAWGMVDDFQKIAKATGSLTSEVAGTVTKFLQQGKSLSQATQLAEAALKAAKIAGIDASRSVDLLTNAMNGFQMSANQALEVSDKFAALAAQSATDYEELAVALSKVAAQANLAGMSMDFTLGMLAKGIEVTREAPETIGTALKTVISRMRELTDYGETLEEGMDVNRVETALKNVGVQLRDTNGQFRNLDDVLTELGGRWNELNTNQQANVAVALAGTRQQSRLIAMMQDFDRTLELVDISTNSYGATMAQHAEYMGSMQAATDGLKTSYEGLIAGFTDSEFVIGIVNMIAGVVDFADKLLNDFHLIVPLLVLFAGYGLSILGNKIAEHKEQQAINKLKLKEQIIINDKRLTEIKILKSLKDNRIQELESLKLQIQQNKLDKENYKINLQNAIVQAQTNNDVAKEALLKAQLAALSTENIDNKILEENIDKEISLIEAEKQTLMAEETRLLKENVTLEAESAGGFGFIAQAISGLLAPLSIVLSIMTAILSLQELLNAEKRKEIGLTIKSTAKKALEGVVTAATALAKAAANIFTNPAGVIACLAILAAAGFGIAASLGAFKSQEDKEAEAIQQNIEAMQKLQGEIYNLGQASKTVSSLADEFQTLSDKINKTADDTKRLEEIINEFNDAAGYDLLSVGMSYDEVLTAMRAYEASIEGELYNKIKESNETLKKATKTAEQLQKYMTDASGRAIVQQNLAQNYSAFGAASETTKQVILDTIAKNTGTFLGSDGGLNYDIVQSKFNADTISKIDEAVSSGSVVKYREVLKSLNKETQNYLKNSNTLFKHVGGLSDQVAEQIDQLGLTPEQLGQISPILEQNFKNIEKWIQENGGLLSRGQLLTLLYENRSINTGEIEQKLAKARQDLQDFWGSKKYTDFKAIEAIVKDPDKGLNALNSSQRQTYDTVSATLSGLKSEVEKLEAAEEMANMSAQEWFNTLGNVPTLTELYDTIEKTNSSIEKMMKFASGELKDKDAAALMGTYGFLTDYSQDGIMTIDEVLSARQEMLEQTKKELNNALAITDVSTQAAVNPLVSNLGLTWDNIKSMSAQDLMALSGKMDAGDHQKLVDAWRQYFNYKAVVDEYNTTDGVTQAELDKAAESTALKLAQAQYNAAKEELDLFASSEEGYTAALGKTINAASTVLKEAQSQKNELYSMLTKELEGYDFEIIDGNLYYKSPTGVVQSIDSLSGKLYDTFRAAAVAYEKQIEEFADADEAAKEYAQNLANDYIDIKKKQLEEEKEIIEKRKEAYQDYFDKIDALEEEQERQESKESIIRQIAALSSGIDGASKAKIKELQEQLRDIEKEEAEAAKEEARNDLLDSLDDQTAKLDEDMQKLDNSVGILTRTLIANAAGHKFVPVDNGKPLLEQLEDWFKSIGLPGFAEGGFVKHTGLAMVHGSTIKPESFLDAEDTALLGAILEQINTIIEGTSNIYNSEVTDSVQTISIENINIKTESMNNNQDFKNAGSALAQEFAKIIRERGLNVDVKK